MRSPMLMLALRAACNSVTGVELDQEFTQRVGEQATVRGVNLHVLFEEVELLRLEPYPETPGPIPPVRYRGRLVARRAG